MNRFFVVTTSIFDLMAVRDSAKRAHQGLHKLVKETEASCIGIK